MDTQRNESRAHKLPNRSLLRTIERLGTIIFLTGAGILAYIIYWEEFKTHSGLRQPSGFHWYHWAVPMFIGLIIWVPAWLLMDTNYMEVQQGRVIDKYINGRGHELRLLGKNRAGETVTGTIAVTAGTYEEYKKGDYFPRS